MSGQMIDWDFAVATATRLAGPGPEVSRAEADEVVAELRAGAARSTGLVRDYTGLTADAGSAPVLVVDRRGWIQANADSFATLINPVVDKLASRRSGRGIPAGGLSEAVGSRVTGLEVGSLLGFLAGKVLGQFDPFSGEPGGREVGRLLLVAPNIVHTEREIGADPTDFRLWVCLHEETHRVQFTATPWLADHLLAEVRALISELMLEPSQFAERLASVARGLPDMLRGNGSGAPLLDALQTPAQRERLAGVTAVMSLLEGHADVVMDDVGPEVVPSVAVIRRRFSRRRAGRGTVDQLLRRLLGLDAKARQYADGARFVRGVVERVGMDGFNKVFSSPLTLPRLDELGDPDAWVTRVHGAVGPLPSVG
jgi:coenzyme F420 biosynthesis associated uncharacterized protein